MKKLILAIDQGTTSSRAIIFDKKGKIKALSQQEFRQIYPKAGWVEHDPAEIWSSQLSAISEVLSGGGIDPELIAALGITNQRETTVLWDRKTGKPVYNAIVWQDRRTSDVCSRLKAEGHEQFIKSKTGLIIDAYFSATKIKWILDHIDGVRRKAEAGEVLFGTIDTWLVWNLTNGKKHVTDVTNASRTMLYNIHRQKWDNDILKLLDIPASILPEVRSSSEIFGEVNLADINLHVPVAGIAGDQQSALFGQMCIYPGMLKNTYGTGGFMVLNTGETAIASENNLLTTIGWKIDGTVNYALEGSIFVAGAVVQWLRDELNIIQSSSEIEELARAVNDNGGVYMVPAFVGLGAPHWDQFARGTIFGLTRGTKKEHLARAALESIAFQTLDVLRAMETDSGITVQELRVDGGATANNLLLQLQADIIGIPIVRPKVSETTGLGAAFLAGLAVGFWESYKEISAFWEVDSTFLPQDDSDKITEMIHYWNKAVKASKNWLEKE